MFDIQTSKTEEEINIAFVVNNNLVTAIYIFRTEPKLKEQILKHLIV